MNYSVESEAWRTRVAKWIGGDAVLLHVSSISSDIRIYSLGNKVVKMRRLTPASVKGRQLSLEGEFQVLKHLAGRKNRRVVIPKPLEYFGDGEWEAFTMKRVEPPRAGDPVVSPVKDRLGDVWALALAVWALNGSGVSHGDLLRANAGYNAQNEFVILDFDQAMQGTMFRCLLRDFFGVPYRGIGAQFSVAGRLVRLPVFSPFVHVARAVRRTLAKRRRRKDGPLSLAEECARTGDRSLSLLAEAWGKAAASGATRPDELTAYYSLDVGGVHFPGERAWVMRWNIISCGVNFKGKHIIELGSNMALLAIHAMWAGAARATAADGSAGVIEAAEIAAGAFGVKLELHTVDFDTDANWEDLLGPGDLVTALSLTHWLRDKERLWRYLARFDEILFEGHEPVEEIRLRFQHAGFREIRELGISERNRPLLYATRTKDAKFSAKT